MDGFFLEFSGQEIINIAMGVIAFVFIAVALRHRTTSPSSPVIQIINHQTFGDLNIGTDEQTK